MHSRIDFESAAQKIRAAYRDGPIEPLRGVLDPLDVEGAYAVQSINTRYWMQHDRRVVGHKIGLTAKAVQRQLGVDRPDHGVLFDDMRVADAGVLAADLIQPRVEAEIALILARDLRDPDATPKQVRAATDHIVAAIEIVDSRIRDWRITFADTVADNGSSAFFVLGSAPLPLAERDLTQCEMRLEIDGNLVSSGGGKAAEQPDPLSSAAWLARTLARFEDGLRAGDIILTGALGPMVRLERRCAVRAQIDELGWVSFDYTGGTQWR
jgi:2-keto-4-pentenoate hydratase